LRPWWRGEPEERVEACCGGSHVRRLSDRLRHRHRRQLPRLGLLDGRACRDHQCDSTPLGAPRARKESAGRVQPAGLIDEIPTKPILANPHGSDGCAHRALRLVLRGNALPVATETSGPLLHPARGRLTWPDDTVEDSTLRDGITCRTRSSARPSGSGSSGRILTLVGHDGTLDDRAVPTSQHLPSRPLLHQLVSACPNRRPRSVAASRYTRSDRATSLLSWESIGLSLSASSAK
jgi:hypothetical protein